jgi:hypothetical protein
VGILAEGLSVNNIGIALLLERGVMVLNATYNNISVITWW